MIVLRIIKIWRNLASHPLNPTILHAAMRWCVWQTRARLTKNVTLTWVNGIKLTGRHGMISMSLQAYNGIHELRDMCFAVHLLERDDLFFDVGANIGIYALLLGQLGGARGIAFEPVPETSEFLAANIRQNDLSNQVILERAAVAASPGQVAISTDADVMNKIVEGDAGYMVPSLTIDGCVTQHGVPVLIKVDVEGFEPEVLRGAKQTLHDPRLLALILEINDNARDDATSGMLADLQAAGFEEVDYDPVARRLIEPVPDQHHDNRLFVKSIARANIDSRLKRGAVISVRGRAF